MRQGWLSIDVQYVDLCCEIDTAGVSAGAFLYAGERAVVLSVLLAPIRPGQGFEVCC